MTTTIKPSLNFFHNIWGKWNTSLASIQSLDSLNYSLVFQPIPPAMTEKSAPLGRNSLGLDPADGPLMLVLLAFVWNSPNDDIQIIRIQQDLLDQVNKAAAVQGVQVVCLEGDGQSTYIG